MEKWALFQDVVRAQTDANASYEGRDRYSLIFLTHDMERDETSHELSLMRGLILFPHTMLQNETMRPVF